MQRASNRAIASDREIARIEGTYFVSLPPETRRHLAKYAKRCGFSIQTINRKHTKYLEIIYNQVILHIPFRPYDSQWKQFKQSIGGPIATEYNAYHGVYTYDPLGFIVFRGDHYDVTLPLCEELVLALRNL